MHAVEFGRWSLRGRWSRLVCVALVMLFGVSLCAASGNPPTISVEPASQTVVAGNPATFSVTASGDGALSYQWQYYSSSAGWVPFGAGTGTTSAVMTTNPAPAAANGMQFRVVVTNTLNGTTTTATSSTATLNVNSHLMVIVSRN